MTITRFRHLDREPEHEWRRHLLWLGLATTAVLLPFMTKAFHIDDPLFLWTAEQITVSPADFYGFDVNWYGVIEPMHAINKNPPLVGYYLAAVAAIGGWSEITLHLAMSIPAVALVIGIAVLARRFSPNPAIAAAVALVTPAFAVSANSLMSDVTMSALWCWALIFFLRGFESNRWADFCVAGLLMGLCALTKYFGLALLPLSLLYAVTRVRGPGRWVVTIALATAVVAGFDFYTHARYGLHPLFDVVGYATKSDLPYSLPLAKRAATGLFFLGGCTLGTMFFAPWLWTLRTLAGLVFASGLVAAACVRVFEDPGLGFDLHLQQAIFAMAGLHVFALAGRDLMRERSPESLLLVVWLVGVFVFAAFTNWTTNGRSILPAIPAIGILVARAMANRGAMRRIVVIPILASSAALAFSIAAADAQLANSARTAARTLVDQSRNGPGALYFQGSWGFQRYMEQAGVSKLVLGQTVLEPGDRIVVPGNNTNLVRLPAGRVKRVSLETFPKSPWISILSRPRSAGFYASVWGSLPFSFGATKDESYAVYEMTSRWAPKGRGGPRVRARVKARMRDAGS
ncbi:MAG: glycosyltransferase family 39 protein [Deltaproteobacteria bacterium]|nr:glycosyltransferase family 39 protein [Deltaproteobacteria bacterium]